jgi:hypothetical protein
MRNTSALTLIKNSFLMPELKKPTQAGNLRRDYSLLNNNGGSLDNRKNLSNYQLPVPPAREVLTIEDWRDAIIETEKSILPYRVLVQEIYRDTVLNPHVKSCIERRKELTLLRKFAMCDMSGNPDKEWTNYLSAPWFSDFLSYSLDALFFGYSLISLGDIAENEFPQLSIIRRDLISPERKHVTSIPYNPAGYSWDDPEYAPWHIWLPTPTENGTNSCGLGLLYSVALREINLRNLYGFNMDFLEMFGAPYRALFMENATDTTERSKGIAALNNQGGENWGLFGKDDRLEFLSPTGGSGWKSYSEAEGRWNKDISKVLLGHADALDSVPGKLGSSQGGGKGGGDHSPVKDALVAKQQMDANYLTPIINRILFPKMRELGIEVPEDLYFTFLNSEEDVMIRDKNLDMSVKMSEVVKNLIGSGYEVDQAYFEEATGIKLTKSTIQKQIF